MVQRDEDKWNMWSVCAGSGSEADLEVEVDRLEKVDS